MSELPNDDSELEPSRVSLLSPVWSERKERRFCGSRVLVRERVCESVREKVDDGFLYLVWVVHPTRVSSGLKGVCNPTGPTIYCSLETEWSRVMVSVH